MGRAVCAAVEADTDLVLVAAVDRDGRRAAAGRWRRLLDRTPGVRRHRLRCRRRLHRRRRCSGIAAMARGHGIHAVVGTTGFSADDVARRSTPRSSARRRPELCDRAELRDLGGADDALRRDGGAVVRHRRGDRVASHAQDRRPVGHCGDDDRADGRSTRRPTSPPIRPSTRCIRELAGAWARGTSAPTPCGWRGWSPTRR